jgi:hypothetical protein
MPNSNKKHEVHLDDLLPKRYVKLVGEIQLDDGEIEVKVKYPTRKLIKIIVSSGGLTGFLLMVLKILGFIP